MFKAILIMIFFASFSALAHNMPKSVKDEKFLTAIKNNPALSSFKVSPQAQIETYFTSYNPLSLLAGIPSKVGDSDWEGIVIPMTKNDQSYTLSCDSLHTSEERLELNGMEGLSFNYQYKINFYDCQLENELTGRTESVFLASDQWFQKQRY